MRMYPEIIADQQAEIDRLQTELIARDKAIKALTDELLNIRITKNMPPGVTTSGMTKTPL